MDVVAQILALVPPWTRVYRIQRDIPMPLVTSGVDHGNLRYVRFVYIVVVYVLLVCVLTVWWRGGICVLLLLNAW